MEVLKEIIIGNGVSFRVNPVDLLTISPGEHVLTIGTPDEITDRLMTMFFEFVDKPTEEDIPLIHEILRENGVSHGIFKVGFVEGDCVKLLNRFAGDFIVTVTGDKFSTTSALN